MILVACGQKEQQVEKSRTAQNSLTEIASKRGDENTIKTRFNTPEGYLRIVTDTTSFSNHLQSLPLKPVGSEVSLYNGEIKPNRNVYDAVVDLPIGKRDLHQCADAIIRLRADYLFQNKKYDSIHFNFTNGFKADYANWRKGKRIVVNGNQVYWKQKTQASDTPQNFWKYLEMVFSYAGTASLTKELKPVPINEMHIGDIFIKGGFPGHAVIVVDMAINKTTKDKTFLLAQSFMPAQEIQVLKNLNSADLSPWYRISDISTTLHTPEWTFKSSDLKRFPN